MTAEGVKPSPWVLAGHPSSLGDPTELVTLVDGQTFCLSSRTGDFDTNPTHGVFFADMRVLSRARLLIGGIPVEPLAVHQDEANEATFVGRCQAPGGAGGDFIVVRRRQLGAIWHEQLEIRNWSGSDLNVNVDLEVEADFADVFAIKEGRLDSEGSRQTEIHDHSVSFRWRLGEIHRQAELVVSADGVRVSPQGFHWRLDLSRRQVWTVDVDLSVAVGLRWIERQHHSPNMDRAEKRNEEWLASRPRLRSPDRTLNSAYERSLADIAALRLHDPAGRRRPVVAAGAPWYMTLFGRDALITAYMALPIDTDLALGVLDALAELQGEQVNAETEEEPGRIVHETRQLNLASITLTRHGTYFGAADATPLFVVLLGELTRWGMRRADLERLVVHADRAIAWMEEYGDRDGDGYIEYQRSSPRGLVNQGWKDSVDAIRFRDGSIAQTPLALCEVQGYAYAAYRARAVIASELGQHDVRESCLAKAAELKERFNRDFWIEELGWFAIALDADKRQVDSLTSNIGHCLWSGIVADRHVKAVAERLVSPPMWTGWGLRTLAADEVAYDPVSYHCGTVWPHDVALCVAGLAANGHTKEALMVTDGLLGASVQLNARLPEFFCGFDRRDIPTPVPFPTSCSPQAWAAATPLLLLRVMLGIEPDATTGLRAKPIDHAAAVGTVLTGVRCRGHTFDIRIESSGAKVTSGGSIRPVERQPTS